MPNYRPVVQKLIDEAKREGYHPVVVRDEEGSYPSATASTADIISNATATDVASIKFRDYRIPKDVFGSYLTFYLVYGNALDETINDHTDHGTADRIALAVSEAFS